MSYNQEFHRVPTTEQIEKAAYDRWERRGRMHGWDREDWLAAEQDLTFAFNYRPVVRRPPAPAPPTSSAIDRGGSNASRCRFCEQAVESAPTAPSRPLIPFFSSEPSIVAGDVCAECVQAFHDHLEEPLERFWGALPGLFAEPRSSDSAAPLPAFKALAWIALALMPEADLEYFPDAVEWVNNPEHDEDSSLFSRLACLAYHAPALADAPGWVALERRADDDSALPSRLLFVARDGWIVQFPVPLGTLDQDLDGEEVRLLPRSWSPAGSCDRVASRLVGPSPTRASRPRRRWLGIGG